MTTTEAPPLNYEPKPEFDPDSFRMTMGEHLEELRRRLLYGLVGLVVAGGVCFYFGQTVMGIFIAPLVHELHRNNLNPQLVYTELSDGFMVYVKVSIISAAVLSAPWMVYQIWQFVAAGLYPHERKYITRYVPLSIGLLIAGVIFVYFIILPWTIAFFLDFSGGVRLREQNTAVVATNVPPTGLAHAPLINGDPAAPVPGDFWFNSTEGRLKFFFAKGDVRVLQFNASNLLTPQLSLPEYIDMVLTTLLTFGLCFQLPLVVMTLSRIGIVPIAVMRSARRYVYFGLAVLAATMTPGDVITAMLALMAPLIVLYELGILLAVWGAKRADQERDAEANA